MTPNIAWQYVERVGSKESNVYAFVFPKFTIEQDKVFKVTIGEQNGGRILLLAADFKFIGLN